MAAQYGGSDQAHTKQKPLGSKSTPSGAEQPAWSRWGTAEEGEKQGKGRGAFEEATSLLLKVKPAAAPWYDFDKNAGVVGAGAYYAKELFFLFS